jgi:hypothetical protein
MKVTGSMIFSQGSNSETPGLNSLRDCSMEACSSNETAIMPASQPGSYHGAENK